MRSIFVVSHQRRKFFNVKIFPNYMVSQLINCKYVICIWITTTLTSKYHFLLLIACSFTVYSSHNGHPLAIYQTELMISPPISWFVLHFQIKKSNGCSLCFYDCQCMVPNAQQVLRQTSKKSLIITVPQCKLEI